MKIRLKRSALLPSLVIAVSTHFALPAAADSTADLILTLKCPNNYTLKAVLYYPEPRISNVNWKLLLQS